MFFYWCIQKMKMLFLCCVANCNIIILCTSSTPIFEVTWICTECREAECFDDADAPLLLCDGKCNRPFHPPCANLASLPPDDEPWLCRDCVQEHHQCTVCKEYGKDDVDVFCCDAKGKL